MTLTVGTMAGNKSAIDIVVGTATGNKTVTEGWVGTPSGNKQFYAGPTPPPFTVTLSPPSSAAVTNGDTFQFGALTATPHDGVGPYSYVYTAEDQLDGLWTFPGGSTSQTVTPRAQAYGYFTRARLQVVVSDLGNPGSTATASAVFTMINTSVPPS